MMTVTPVHAPQLYTSKSDVHILTHGLNYVGNGEITRTEAPKPFWREVQLPNPLDAVLPGWMTELQIDWSEGYSNPPSFKAIVAEHTWEFSKGAVWENIDSAWFAQAPDGRIVTHWHKGSLTWNPDLKAWMTPQEEGYARRPFPITMKVGAPIKGHPGELFTEENNSVILRGPWHGGAKNGYLSLATRKPSDGCFCFGLDVPHSLIVNAFPIFFPGMRMIEIANYNSISDDPKKVTWHLEPLRAGQTLPKRILQGY